MRAASIVSRWSVIWTLQPDNVAQHTFFVAVYTRLIADLIGWEGNRARLLTYALVHDADELITGDTVGVVKHEIIDPVRNDRFVARKLEELAPSLADLHHDSLVNYPELALEIKAIVRAADRLDALFFMLMEGALGNQIIRARVPSGTERLREAWFKMPANDIRLLNLWNDVILPAIDEHSNPANYDIT